MKTLVLCPIGLGNFIMVSPALRLLAAELGAENVHFLALKGGIRELAEASGYFGQVHFWDPDKASPVHGLALAAKLRSQAFDCSVSLFPSGDWKFALFAALVGARRRVGFAYPRSKWPERAQTESFEIDYDAHDTDQNVRLVEMLLGKPSDAPRHLEYPFEPEHPQMRTLRARRYYVVHPGSSTERGMREKRLPAAAFRTLIQRIHQTYGLPAALVGGPEEADLREEVADGIRECLLPIDSRNLRELAGIVQNARFYLGNDSGLMHISASLGLPCIAFFGPTDDRRNGPYSEELRFGRPGPHLVLRREDLACSPCWTGRTVGTRPACIYGDVRCLRQFEADAAWPKIRAFIDRQMGSLPVTSERPSSLIHAA